MNTDKYISGIKEKVSKKIESLRSEAQPKKRSTRSIQKLGRYGISEIHDKIRKASERGG